MGSLIPFLLTRFLSFRSSSSERAGPGKKSAVAVLAARRAIMPLSTQAAVIRSRPAIQLHLVKPSNSIPDIPQNVLHLSRQQTPLIFPCPAPQCGGGRLSTCVRLLFTRHHRVATPWRGNKLARHPPRGAGITPDRALGTWRPPHGAQEPRRRHLLSRPSTDMICAT